MRTSLIFSRLGAVLFVSMSHLVLAWSALAAGPACTAEAHISTPTYIVDQAWQDYRNLPPGWCQCAKPCEPIDREAAIPETQALAINEARIAPGLTSAQRTQMLKRANELFAQRAAEAKNFQNCLIAQKPPLQGSVTVCNTQTAEQKLIEDWAKWCQKFEAKWFEIESTYFLPAYRNAAGQHEFSAFLLAKPNGRISVSGSVGGQGVSAANRSALQSHINQIVMPPLPAGSSWIGKGGFLWPTYASMTVQNEAATAGSWRIGMPCPGTTYTKKDGSTAKIAL